jgi:hypothetical protein
MLAPALNLIVGQRLLRKLHTCGTLQETTLGENEEIKAMLRSIQQVAPQKAPAFDGKMFVPV